MFELRLYQTADGRTPFTEWLGCLRDPIANRSVAARLTRLQVGHRGDWKAVGDGVFELRIDSGPGYRIYCGQDGDTLILLICAGDKRSQKRDIDHAKTCWNDYQERRERGL